MRESVRQNKLIFSIHAVEEMDADDLLKADIVNCILFGEIATRQWVMTFRNGSIWWMGKR